MSKDGQLATREQATESAILDIRALSKAGGTLTALLEHLQQDRVLLPGGQTTSSTLAAIGNLVVRIDTEFLTGGLQFNWARNSISYPRPVIRTTLQEASEADVLDAQRAAEQNGSGADRVLVARLLKLVRQANQPAEPLAITIVNAKEVFSPAKILSVKRDDSGKLSGATIEPVG